MRRSSGWAREFFRSRLSPVQSPPDGRAVVRARPPGRQLHDLEPGRRAWPGAAAHANHTAASIPATTSLPWLSTALFCPNLDATVQDVLARRRIDAAIAPDAVLDRSWASAAVSYCSPERSRRGCSSLVPAFLRDALAAPAAAGPSPYGPLGAADANGLSCPRASRRGASRSPGSLWVRRYALPRLPRRPGDVQDQRRRLDPRHQLRVGGGRRRRHLGDPLRGRRDDHGRVPHPRRHHAQLRRRPDAVGHVAVWRGGRAAA